MKIMLDNGRTMVYSELTKQIKNKSEVVKMLKTRRAYGTDASGKVYDLGDTVDQALKANMMVRDFEKELIKLNPQLEIEIRIEEK
jgi:hypothetical protein